MKKTHLILSLGLFTLPLQACDLVDKINYADDKKAYYEKVENNKEQVTETENDGLFGGQLGGGSDSKTAENSTNTVSVEGTFKAKWTGTTDGDTIKIKTDNGTETVRLLLVDTPESVKVGTEQQLYSLNASRYTKSLMKENPTVSVEVGEVEKDDYGRLLAYVYLEDGSMLNELLVRGGYARVGYVFNDKTYLKQLQKAQDKAKSEKLRIWSVDGYVTDEGYNMDVVTDKDIRNSVE